MKKLIAMVLTAVMTLSGAVFTQAAETINIDCQMSETNVEIGDTFYADFKITDNPVGYNNMFAYLKYDSKVIRAIPYDSSELPDDLITYTNQSTGYVSSLFSYRFLSDRINFVPSKGDRDYDGGADGRKTAAEIGILKLTNYLDATVDRLFQNYEGTGTLMRVKFEAVGGGSTNIELTDTSAAYFVDGVSNSLNVSAASGSITVNGAPIADDEPSTEATTAAQTNNNNSNNSNNSSSGGGGGSVAVKPETTTEEATDTEKATEAATTAPVNNNTAATAISFKDVKSGDWFYEPVMKLASAKVVNGYTADNTFRPNNNVTRADFILMLLRGIGVDTTKAPSSNFADVASTKYYYNAVGIAKEMGIASGDGTNFNPESNITRQDMMILAKKALETGLNRTITGDVSVLDQFSDKAQISSYATESLAAMVSEGIVSGMGNGIVPKAQTTRAQAVVIISKIMDKLM